MSYQQGRQLGNYKIIRLLGHGSFGEVYLGEHILIQRQAAIKVLTTRLTPQVHAQFQAEAQIIANLNHPHIVKLLEFGAEGSIPYLVMDYAAKGTLRTRHPRGPKLPLNTVITYTKQIAEALQYAHDQPKPVIHRDVKPENILIGQRGELLLSDFGIATIGVATSKPVLQNQAGTPLYMAPEQTRGQPRRASDQYALGIMVYEWLSGDVPFHGTPFEVMAQHARASPSPLLPRVSWLPSEVERVVLRALEKDPDKRFPSVKVFADALGQATAPRRVTQSGPAPSSPPVGTPHCTYHGHSEAILNIAYSPDGKLIASRAADGSIHIWDASTGDAVSHYQGASGSGLQAMKWSPDGKHIAMLSSSRQQPPQTSGYTQPGFSLPAYPYQPQTALSLEVWEAKTSKKINLPGNLSGAITAFAWSPDGQKLAVASENKVVYMWNLSGGTSLAYQVHTASVRAVAWSADGTKIASGGDDGRVLIWNPTTRKTFLAYPSHSGNSVLLIGWSRDGQRIASADSTGFIHIWDASLGARGIIFQASYSGPLVGMAWSPDGIWIASCDTYGVYVWSASNGVLVAQNYTRLSDQAVSWSSDGRRLAVGTHASSGSSIPEVQIWNSQDWMILHRYTSHQRGTTIHAVAWSPDGQRIASAGTDAMVQVWQADGVFPLSPQPGPKVGYGFLHPTKRGSDPTGV